MIDYKKTIEAIEYQIAEYPEEVGHFRNGMVAVAWHVKPNWLFRFIAKQAGWRWEPK